MAELKLKILADLKQLRIDISKLLKEKFKIGIEGDKDGKGGMLGRLGLGKIALISAGVIAIGAGIKKLVRSLANSSPYLKGVFSMFKRASMHFFRPFGDFLATLLKPLAIVLLRASAKWMSLFRGGEGEGPFEKIKKLLEDFFTGEFDFGEWLIENIPKFIIGLFDFGVWLGETIADFVIGLFNLGVWLGERLADFVVGLFDFGVWLGGIIASYIKGEFDLGEWLGDNIDPFFHGVFDVGEWLGETFIDFFFIEPFKMGEWLGERMGDFIIGAFDLGAWLWENLSDFIKGLFKPEGKQMGGKIEETGIYKLHKGEEVTPAHRVGKTGKTTIFRPTFNFMGNLTSEIDVDTLMRRASRQAELNLRRFTAI